MQNHKINNWIENYPGIWQGRSLDQIKYIGVCHTASELTGKSLKQICDDIDSWHKNNGWPCISYHYVISENGEIAQTNDLNANSYTVGNRRQNTVCVCLDGNFEIDKPTMEQLEALDWLLNELSFNHPEFPATQQDVFGDNELNLDTGNPTACPGANLTPLVQEWRDTGRFSILDLEQKSVEAVVPERVVEVPKPAPVEVVKVESQPATLESKTTDYGQLAKIISTLLTAISPFILMYFGFAIDPIIPAITTLMTSIILLFTNPNLKK
jgi:N-acetylmuramoyl-L-alanine amidase